MIYDFVKRTLDLVGAVFGLIILLPLLLAAAVLVKLTSEGPILVEESTRVGKSEKNFRMFKFRSMIKNSHQLIRTDPKFNNLLEEYKNNSFKLSQDPRVTPLGRFLRRTSIDELPQLLNVIKGEMSLVGPRAYYPDELEEQRSKFPACEDQVKKSLQSRPGMTGLWQVSGRSRVGFEERIKMDADYASSRSPLLDLKIILKTPIAIVRGEGV